MGWLFSNEKVKAREANYNFFMDASTARSFKAKLRGEFLKGGEQRWLWWGHKEQLWYSLFSLSNPVKWWCKWSRGVCNANGMPRVAQVWSYSRDNWKWFLFSNSVWLHQSVLGDLWTGWRFFTFQASWIVASTTFWERLIALQML